MENRYIQSKMKIKNKNYHMWGYAVNESPPTVDTSWIWNRNVTS